MNDPLSTAALLGTARSPGLPAASHELLSAPWSGLASCDSPLALLRAAALESAALRAGRQPITNVALPEPSREEGKPVVPPAASQAAVQMLKGEFSHGLPEWLAACARAGMVSSARLLPALFDHGNRHHALQPAIRQVAGERGLWLATRDPRWAWVIEESAVPDEAWETGSHAERIAWLRQTRPTDAARAAQAITAEWKTESPEMRESIAKLAARRPLAEDLLWLEPLALADRRQATRQLATQALMSLPGSSFRERVRARVASLVSVKGLRKVLTLHPPDQFEAAWSEDNIKETPPKGTGQKAWWARQILAQLPLADWSSVLNLPAKDMFKSRLDSDWAETIVLAWLDSALAHPNRELLESFLPFLLSLKGKYPSLKAPESSLEALLRPHPPAQQVSLLEGLKLETATALHLLVRLQPPLDTKRHPRLTKVLKSWWSAKNHSLTRPEANALAFCPDPASIRQLLVELAALSELSSSAEAFARTLEFRQTYLPHFHSL